MTMNRTLTALATGVLAILPVRPLAAAEAIISGSRLELAGTGTKVTADLGGPEVALEVGGKRLAGRGTLLVARANGVVSDLLQGGADRGVGDADTVVVRFGGDPGAGWVVLATVGGGAGVARIPLAALGFRGHVYAVYDRAGNTVQGPVAMTLTHALAAGQVAVLAVAEVNDHPALLASSGEVTDGVPASAWDAAARALTGTVIVGADGVAEVRLVAPPVPVRWVAKTATVGGGQAALEQAGEWVTVRITGAKAGPAVWSVAFAQEPAPAAAEAKAEFTASAPAPRCVILASSVHGPQVLVRRDDGAEFVMAEPTLSDTRVSGQKAYTYTLHRALWSGLSPALAQVSVTTPGRPPLPAPPDVHLAELTPAKATNGWNGDPRQDKSIEDNPIRIRGETFPRGMGVHALAELVYDLKPEYARFVAVVGVDDEKEGAGSVGFRVVADDRELLATPVLTGGDERFTIDVELPAGAKQLHLIVNDGGDGVGCDHADWANAGFRLRK